MVSSLLSVHISGLEKAQKCIGSRGCLFGSSGRVLNVSEAKDQDGMGKGRAM